MNIHLVAFDSEGLIRKAQLEPVFAAAEREYRTGHHVVVGGDWNLVLAATDFPHDTEERFLFCW
ncbi:MAG: hypothetical protein FJX53_00120 [Alphaproteobacteria bacterium]|nr:hypothetical protein [Alphaproteobacteria bacterium]